MPRKPLIRSDTYPYHVIARTNNKDWFYLPITEAWDLFNEYLGKISVVYEVKIHCFVLMSNHFHLLASTPQKNLDDAMEYLLREVSRSINRNTGRINHIFGGPYKWSLIYSYYHYKHAFKYVARNPVKAGLAPRVEMYPYSTLHPEGLFRFRLERTFFEEKYVGNYPIAAELNWLNLRYNPEEYDYVRRAIRRREFKFSLQRNHDCLPFSLRSESNPEK